MKSYLSSHRREAKTIFVLLRAILVLAPPLFLSGCGSSPISPGDEDEKDFDLPPSLRGVQLAEAGTEKVYFTYNGKPLLSFGGGSDYIFYADQDTFDYIRWADWAAAHGMNHIRAYPPFSWTMIEHVSSENGGSKSKLLFPYQETSPGNRQFDLNRFDPAYWAHFRKQLKYLESKGVIVHLLMINGWQAKISDPSYLNWDGHFFNPANNVNAFTDYLSTAPAKFYSSVADNQTVLIDVQEAWYRKIIDETHDLDNVYYDLVHEMATHDEDWAKTQEWIKHMANIVRQRWAKYETRPIVLGMDSGGFNATGHRRVPKSGTQVDWIATRPYFDVVIFGKRHFYKNTRDWRIHYRKPYIGQEISDDNGKKYSYGKTADRHHTRKYMWKFMMAKAQQMDLYYWPGRSTRQSKYWLINYDPNGYNRFEDDAMILRQFWNQLMDYPNLWFQGHVETGPGSHRYVLSSLKEALVYLSSATGQENVNYDSQLLELRNLALSDGAVQVSIVDPKIGILDKYSATISEGNVNLLLPAFTDDIAVHFTK